MSTVPLPSTRTHLPDILRLALPASAEAVIQLLFNFLAQLIVATLGATAVAAVGLSNNVTMVLMFTLATLGSGAGILVARAHGAGDRGAVNRTAGTALLLALGVTTLIVAGLYTSAGPVLGLLGAPADLLAAATPFFQVALLSVPLIVLSVVAGNVLRSLERPRIPMVATLIAAAVNVGVGYALVHGAFGLPRLGLVGAAWGALAGQAVRVGLLAVFLYGPRGPIAPAWSGVGAGGRGLVRDLLNLSLPLAATQLAWSGGNLLYALFLARLGTEVLAGVQIGYTLEGIFVVASSGLVPAATALIGQAVGQRDAALAAERARAVERFGLVTGVAFGVLFALSALVLPLLYPSVGAEVRGIALATILVNAAVQVVKVANMVRGAGVLPSGSDTRGVLIGDAISAFGVGLPLAWLLAFPLGLGFWGVLVARVLEEVVKIAIFTWRRRKLSWGQVIAGQTALNAAMD
ncbi:putative MATE family efflux protein [Deinococcus sp. HSC-46F16]|uniref:MATE family efflux transporter n=1 Tax=Deinococcus sp. HSC-46F16 TaxID=2910968 RepID=UPI0020A0DE6D|nr:MATE family efflux transporter [Deinococcus sp. HSC-46F16]MCP2013699.1 putative MATE family efflux protein [Deinococcus sp. HSC-46F16]